MRKDYAAAELSAAILLAAAIPVIAAAQAKLAPGVEKAADFTPSSPAYVVTNDAQLYKSPAFNPEKQVGVTLKRGEHPEVLGETTGGVWVLIGKGGTGIGYVQRGLLCPASVCKDVKS